MKDETSHPTHLCRKNGIFEAPDHGTRELLFAFEAVETGVEGLDEGVVVFREKF